MRFAVLLSALAMFVLTEAALATSHTPTLPPPRDPGGGTTPDPVVTPDPTRLLEQIPEIPPANPTPPAPPSGSDELLILLNGETGSLLTDYGLDTRDDFFVQALGRRALLVAVDDDQDSLALLDLLRLDQRVFLVQPNYTHTAQFNGRVAALPTDPDHRVLAAAPGPVVVGLIDTGVDTSHPALDGHAIESVDVVDGGGPVGDHGTALAALILADNGAGRAPLRLLAVNAFVIDPAVSDLPLSDSRLLIKAVDIAITRTVDVLNLSFVGPFDPVIKLLIEIAAINGMFVVAAAGNNGPGAPPAYPAAHETVVAVTATDSRDRLYTAANRGEYVELAALGVDITVAAVGGKFGIASGTSLAAARISGVVAGLMTQSHGIAAADLRRLLGETAVDLGAPGRDPEFGVGRVAPGAALEAASAYAGVTSQ